MRLFEFEIQRSHKDFKVSGDTYFRPYRYDETFFKADRDVWYGQHMPFSTKKGIPTGDSKSKFFIFYTYPKGD